MIELSYKDKEEWLALRKGYIGGSDAAAVLGLDEYKSPYSLWAEKTGKIPEFKGNITTKVGAFLEQFVADMWSEETGKKLRKKNRILVNEAYPWACADVDRLVVGEKSLLEIKTTNSFPIMRKCKDGTFPDRWYVQMMHYLAVTGLEKAYLAVLLNCRDVLYYELSRDEDEIAALMKAEEAFWEKVKNDNQPDVDGSEATSDALNTIYADAVPGEVELFGREGLFEQYADLKLQKKAIEGKITEVENIIKDDMGEAERGFIADHKVMWKNQVRSSFDTKKFASAHPEIDLTPFYKESTSRVFRVLA